MLTILFEKKNPDAIIPTKANDFAIGYDLTCIAKESETNGCIMYDTGIAVQAPDGYYTEVIPRSSFAKTGYIFANSVGIIDPDYRGSIKIALRKIDKDSPDLELPFKRFQLVLRKYYEAEVKEGILTETKRGAGGFGSTDAKNSEPAKEYFGDEEILVWRNNKGQKHRDEDLPAVIYPDGSKEWWFNGKRDRKNRNEKGALPAEVWPDGSMFWFSDGVLHRDKNEGPAVVWPDGRQEFWENGSRVEK